MTDPSAVRGNQIYEPRRVCRCDHGETVHDLNSKKVRTACSHMDATGACGCRRYEEVTIQAIDGEAL